MLTSIRTTTHFHCDKKGHIREYRQNPENIKLQKYPYILTVPYPGASPPYPELIIHPSNKKDIHRGQMSSLRHMPNPFTINTSHMP